MPRLGTTVSRMDTPETTAQRFAEEVRAGMEVAGISQRDMAARTGIPLVTLSRRLTGRSPFTIPELAAITSEIGISLVEIALRVERAQAKASA